MINYDTKIIGEGRIIVFSPKTLTVDKDTNIVIYYNSTQDVVGIKDVRQGDKTSYSNKG